MFAQMACEPVVTLRSVLLTQVCVWGGKMVSGSLSPFPGLSAPETAFGHHRLEDRTSASPTDSNGGWGASAHRKGEATRQFS